MYLSRVPLNSARRGTRLFLSSPHVTHAAVMKSFPPGALDQPTGSGRVLWRTDQHDNAIFLYVVSPAEPDFTHIVEQAGWPTTGAWTTRKYGQLLDSLTAGQRWHFRLTANPVRSTKNYSDPAQRESRGKVAGLSAAQQLDWLQRKAIDAGFEIPQCGPIEFAQTDARIVHRAALSFRRGRQMVRLSVATFEGTLVVSEVDSFKAALTEGIGRAKGYGCGLLTVAPPQ